MAENSGMLSTMLVVAALVFALAAAAARRRLARWPRMGRLAVHLAGPLIFAAGMVAAPGFTVVEKMITQLVMPVGVLWLLGYATAWWLVWHGRNRAAGFALGVWLLYSISGNAWVGQAMLKWLEAGYEPPAAEARFDAVMVLGGATNRTRFDEAQLSVAGDRLYIGAKLYARGQTPLLVCSGSGIAGLAPGGPRDIAAEMSEIWNHMGIPPQVIVPLPGPHNTRTEIAALARLVEERGWQRVGMVTSAWHLRRAMLLADRFGLRVTPIPADLRGQIAPPNIVALVPSGLSFLGVQVAVKEMIAPLIGR